MPKVSVHPDFEQEMEREKPGSLLYKFYVVAHDRLSKGLGDWKVLTDTGINGALYEFRIHTGAGYRFYYVFVSGDEILMLAGGLKKSQKKDQRKAEQRYNAMFGKRKSAAGYLHDLWRNWT